MVLQNAAWGNPSKQEELYLETAIRKTLQWRRNQRKYSHPAQKQFLHTQKYYRRCHFPRCVSVQGGVTVGAEMVDLFVRICQIHWHRGPQCNQFIFPWISCFELWEAFIYWWRLCGDNTACEAKQVERRVRLGQPLTQAREISVSSTTCQRDAGRVVSYPS